MRLEDMYPAILTIVLIGIVLGLGIYIMTEVRSEVATDVTGTDNDVNTSTNNATVTLGDASKDAYVLSAITSIANLSEDEIPTTNYTWTTAGVITFTQDYLDSAYLSEGDYLNITSTYTWDRPGSAETAINDATDGVAGFSSWIAIIVVVIAAAIVLGIVLKSFGSKPGV